MCEGQHSRDKNFVIIDNFLTKILCIVDKKLFDKKKILFVLIPVVGF